MGIEEIIKPISAALLIALAFVVPPAISFANKRIEIKPDEGVKLVECSITSADYQQIDVLTLTDGRLALKILDRLGGTQIYDLPRRQWRARAILVPCWNSEDSTCGDFFEHRENRWSYAITGSDGVSIGDCSHKTLPGT